MLNILMELHVTLIQRLPFAGILHIFMFIFNATSDISSSLYQNTHKQIT